jgi:AcrR family transcriptional regulator
MPSQISGLRARKLARTRAALIDAAVDMCLSKGYENTTVQLIAAAAEVSPRTFSRYFASKDASEALRQAAVAYRSPQVLGAMAHRMGVEIDDPQLVLAMELISVTVLRSWSTVVALNVPLDPRTIAEQVDQAFVAVATLAADSDARR